jgi:hypothetical protein
MATNAHKRPLPLTKKNILRATRLLAHLLIDRAAGEGPDGLDVALLDRIAQSLIAHDIECDEGAFEKVQTVDDIADDLRGAIEQLTNRGALVGA